MEEKVKGLGLKEFGRGLINSDAEIRGVKIVIFYNNGDLAEYSSMRDLSLPKEYRKRLD